MKRVSFKTAKAIKDAGYPQENCDEYLNKYGAIDSYLGHNIARPYAMEVWLWLWREKDIRMPIGYHKETFAVVDETNMIVFYSKNDPEEAIISAIGYLVDNDLIK